MENVRNNQRKTTRTPQEKQRETTARLKEKHRQTIGQSQENHRKITVEPEENLRKRKATQQGKQWENNRNSIGRSAHAPASRDSQSRLSGPLCLYRYIYSGKPGVYGRAGGPPGYPLGEVS